jgi:hypothetical protein
MFFTQRSFVQQRPVHTLFTYVLSIHAAALFTCVVYIRSYLFLHATPYALCRIKLFSGPQQFSVTSRYSVALLLDRSCTHKSGLVRLNAEDRLNV